MDAVHLDTPRPDVPADWNWQVLGLCRGDLVDPEIFFEPSGRESAKARRRREEAAKAVCQECPVILQCRRSARTNGERFGVWGGVAAGELVRSARRTA